MELNDFLLLESKDINKARYEFWADEFGNLYLDIDDNEELMDYIKRKSDKLSKEYSHKINGRDAKDLDIEDIIKKMGWFQIILSGKKEDVQLKKYEKDNQEIPEKKIKYNKYDYAIIRVPGKHDANKKNSDDNLKIVIGKIRKLYPTINRVRSIDKDYGVKEIILKDLISKPKNNNKKYKEKVF